MDSDADPALAVPATPASGRDASRCDPGDGRLERAIALAARLHAGQVDKAGQPYILHPLRVMLRLDEPERRIAAVLHDTVEDCDITVDAIRYDFGDLVADAVEALTRRKGESYDDFIERCGRNEIARGVKWADLRDNMDMTRLPVVTEADKERRAKYARACDRLTSISMDAATAAISTSRYSPPPPRHR